MKDGLEIDSEKLNELLHASFVVEKITSIANKLATAANAMASEVVLPSQRDKDNFGVYVQPGGTRARAYVHPLGHTGIHIEQGHAVLLKSIGMVSE